MIESPTFATLEKVRLRQAWPLEAQNFTPWLSENLALIADAVGLTGLDLIQTEARVGRFRADIHARNPRDGTVVVIENQLAHGDHDHLGQALTYLSGLEAQSVIWVAEHFREEHLIAIDWLNKNTIDPFAFYAVTIRVVRIADSPYAPLFEVVRQPKLGERRASETRSVAPEVGPDAMRRRRFWERFVERHPECVGESGRGGTSRWLDVTGIGLVVSRYFSVTGVGVFVRGPLGMTTAQVEERITPHVDDLEVRLGAPLGNPRYAFDKRKAFAGEGDQRWDEMADWLHREANSYAEILKAVMEPVR